MSDAEQFPPEIVSPVEDDLRVQEALAELRGLILQRFPASTFVVSPGPEDPGETWLIPIVDVEDLEDVAAVYMERLVEMQVEEDLPIFVVPEWPRERIRAYYAQLHQRPAEQPRTAVTVAG